MNPKTLSKKFIFNSDIDCEYLFSLYEEDYVYIGEVFGNSIDVLNREIPLMEEAYNNHDLNTLLKAVHKFKPVFGFTGLLRQQELVASFERACAGKQTGDVQEDFRALMQTILMSKIIIEEEFSRLNIFNL